jgi:cytochrome b561
MSAAAASAVWRDAYPMPMRALHWATTLLLVGSYATAWTISDTTTNEVVQSLSLVHRSFGVVVLGLTTIRFAVRQCSRVPGLPEDLPRLQRFAARLNVVGLYGLLFLQPLLGLTASMLHGDRITLLGGLVVPDILPADRNLAHSLFEAHGTVSLLLLGFMGMHIAAALYHHFIRHDDVLAGMLPGVQPLPQQGLPGRSAAPF